MRRVNAPIRFSDVEKKDLVKAWFFTSLAFAIYFVRVGYVDAKGMAVSGFLLLLGIAGLTAGIGFVVHELAHKLTAHYYRVYGEFRANSSMLFISIFLAVMGILIAAPGAVHMMGRISKKENGIISAAGPASNLVLTLAFLPLAFMDGVLGVVGVFGALINSILGAFNLIPFGIFDGAKILAWSKRWYFLLLCSAGVLVFVSYSLF